MGFVKIVKNKAYSKRIRRLTCQDKNKYDSKKYRLVVRRTCSQIIVQVVFSCMDHDKVLCASESLELKGYGLTAGLTNYPAAYCTGLLLARRLLKQVKLDDVYKTNDNVDGEYHNVEEDTQDKRPFKAYLDVGIARTTTGARVFGALKGACDGGMNIPHSTKRFPGFSKGKVEEVTNKRGKSTGDKEKTKDFFDAKIHKERIFGVHVTNYMNRLKKEDATKFKKQFSQWDKCLTANKVKTCEDLYKALHKKIVAGPERKKKAGNKKPNRTVVTKGSDRVFKDSKGRKWLRHFRITNAARKANVDKKFQDAAKRIQGA